MTAPAGRCIKVPHSMEATITEPARESKSLIDRARRLDREIAAAGGLAAYWKTNADPQYRRLVDPVTGATVAER